MRRQLGAALRMLLALTMLTGVAYPLVVTGVGQALFGHEADGSLVSEDGRVVGSSLIRQGFSGDEWFHPRPTAAGSLATGEPGDAEAAGAVNSGASNLGPTNPELLDAVAERVATYREDNGLGPGQPVPVDAVTASGSGLDPHISVRNAELQAPRVARARGLSLGAVLALVHEHTSSRDLGFLGEPGVNVLELNLDVDSQG